MRILIYAFNESGHVLPTFPLARALAARGHEVVYATTLDFRAEVEARGFACVPMHRDVFPLGSVAKLDHVPAEQRPMFVNQQWSLVAHGELMPGWFEKQVRDIDPDIALVDLISWTIAFPIHRLGIPVIRMSTSLSQALDELPPVTTPLTPDATLLELTASRAEAYAQLATIRPLLHGVQTLCTRFGYAPEDVSLQATMVPFMSTYREVVLCPSAFDFPRQRAVRPTYFAFAPELDRVEHIPAELGAFCDGDGPLLYVSLGTQTGRYPRAAAFFRALLAVLGRRSDLRAVIASGDKFGSHESLAAVPSNVLVLRRVPQLWLLRRASLFVTHAGLGSVREAIALRVPMLAVPQAYDQPGNAARIAWHGIGVSLHDSEITEDGLAQRIDHMLRDRATYTERLATLDDACLAESAECQTIEIIERTAATRASASRTAELYPVPSRTIAALQTAGAPLLAWVFAHADGNLPDGGMLRAATTLESPPGTQPELGVAGFAAYGNLGDALGRSTGPLLARVEIAGGATANGPAFVGTTMRCLWVCDATSALLAFGEWCCERAMERECRERPEVAAAVMDAVRANRDLRARGASPEDLQRVVAAIDPALKYDLFRGYVAVRRVLLAPQVHEAARHARWEMAHMVSTAPGADAVEPYIERYRDAIDRADSELYRCVRALTAGLGVEV